MTHYLKCTHPLARGIGANAHRHANKTRVFWISYLSIDVGLVELRSLLTTEYYAVVKNE